MRKTVTQIETVGGTAPGSCFRDNLNKINDMKKTGQTSRRDFLKTGTLVLGTFAAPMIVPARLFGQQAPSNLIRVGQLGCGRIGRTSEVPGCLRNTDLCRIVAVCDLDAIRLDDAKKNLDAQYARLLQNDGYGETRAYRDYEEMLREKDIDAVCISTPDHWHAQQAIEAAAAGKAIYLQKPASLTIQEGWQMVAAVRKSGVIFQLGSQQRSEPQFRLACEAVRNERLGKIKEVHIGLPTDPSGGKTEKMPVPANLDYDRWLGSTPLVDYTEDRVHPQGKDGKPDFGRPGWLRCEQFGAGMITGWGTHHIDIAHWGMGIEYDPITEPFSSDAAAPAKKHPYTGPVEITAHAEFPKPGSGLWDVHGTYEIAAKYADGAMMYISDKKPIGVKFIGENGWLWVTRGGFVPGSDDPKRIAENKKTIDASDPAILTAAFGPNDIRLHASPRNDHHRDWLIGIKERTDPVAPVEAGHRGCYTCLLSHIGMRLGRTIRLDPERERIENDPEAAAMFSREQRAPYGTFAALKRLG